MSSSFGSCDFTGGWQDEGAWSDAYSAGLEQAEQSTQDNSFFVGYSRAAPEQWQSHGMLPLYDDNFDQSAILPLSSSLPTFLTTYQHTQNLPEYSEYSDFERSRSSFSESDFDHLHQQYQCNTNTPTPGASLLPSSMKWAVTTETQPVPLQTASTSQPFDVNAMALQQPNLYQCTLHPPRQPVVDGIHATEPLRPRQQNPRFEHDLYTPTWVRGHGNTRSGWCGYCASWHTLKDSAYWYHMHFAHGISCATGARLPGPCRFQATVGASRGVGDWEALCGECGRWVLVVAGEKGKTAWFRHAYKCNLKGTAAHLGVARRRSKSVRVRDPASPRSARKTTIATTPQSLSPL